MLSDIAHLQEEEAAKINSKSKHPKLGFHENFLLEKANFSANLWSANVT